MRPVRRFDEGLPGKRRERYRSELLDVLERIAIEDTYPELTIIRRPAGRRGAQARPQADEHSLGAGRTSDRFESEDAIRPRSNGARRSRGLPRQAVSGKMRPARWAQDPSGEIAQDIWDIVSNRFDIAVDGPECAGGFGDTADGDGGDPGLSRMLWRACPLPRERTRLFGHRKGGAKPNCVDAIQSGKDASRLDPRRARAASARRLIGFSALRRYLLAHREGEALIPPTDLSTWPSRSTRWSTRVAAGAHPNILHLRRPWDDRKQSVSRER